MIPESWEDRERVAFDLDDDLARRLHDLTDRVNAELPPGVAVPVDVVATGLVENLIEEEIGPDPEPAELLDLYERIEEKREGEDHE